MKRWAIIWICVLSLPGFWARTAFAENKTPAQLEADYDREKNPKKRVKIATQLTDERLKEVLSAYETQDAEKAKEKVENYLAGVDRLEKAIHEIPGSGASKESEIHLRRQAWSLENLKMSVPWGERAPVEEALSRVTKLHEEVLYSIMNPRKPREKQ